jgi:hypothetical protein
MGTTYRPHLILILVAGLVAGCVTAGSLDRGFDDLISLPPSPSRDAGLVNLANDANAKAKSAAEPQDKINYYARAATYAWAAGTDEALRLVISNADAGEQLCATFPANRFKPARDCALLVAFEPVAAGESVLDRVNALKPESPTTTVVGLDSLVAIASQTDQFKGIVVNQWPGVDNVMSAQGTPPDTAAWFDESKQRQWCRFYVMTGQAKRWKLDPATQGESSNARAAIVRNVDAVFDAGHQLVGTNSPSQAMTKCAPFSQPTRPAVPDVGGPETPA